MSDGERVMTDYEREWSNRPAVGAVFMQWKGATVCMDVICPDCGEDGHVCRKDHTYFLRCIKCGSQFALSPFVTLHRSQDDEVHAPGDVNLTEF